MEGETHKNFIAVVLAFQNFVVERYYTKFLMNAQIT